MRGQPQGVPGGDPYPGAVVCELEGAPTRSVRQLVRDLLADHTGVTVEDAVSGPSRPRVHYTTAEGAGVAGMPRLRLVRPRELMVTFRCGGPFWQPHVPELGVDTSWLVWPVRRL